MSKNSVVEHKGIVTEVSENSVFVELTVMSACSACHAKSMCGIDSAQKTIEIIRTDTTSFSTGEFVNVVMREALGKKALFLGYIFPFFVLVLSVVAFSIAGFNEGLTGLLSIGMLVPYFSFLYLFRDRLKREFNFNIEKI